MLQHVLMLESLHRACGGLLTPNFRPSPVLPEHQSGAERCGADEGITKEQNVAGNGLGSFRGENVWIRRAIGNYEQRGTGGGSGISLYLAAYCLVSVSSASSPVSPRGSNARGRAAARGKTCCPSSPFPPITGLLPGAAGLGAPAGSRHCLRCH